jgi:hypothetical protein
MEVINRDGNKDQKALFLVEDIDFEHNDIVEISIGDIMNNVPMALLRSPEKFKENLEQIQKLLPGNSVKDIITRFTIIK